MSRNRRSRGLPDCRFAILGITDGWHELELCLQGETTVGILSLSIERKNDR